MGEMDQVRPLAPASDRMNSDEEDGKKRPSPKKLQKRRCIICCGCCAATTLILAIVILVLALTVFRVRDPDMTLNSIIIDRMKFNKETTSNPSINMTLKADVSIKNPNIASFKFGNSTTLIYYRGTSVGQAYTPAGKASAKRTLQMNVTIDVLADRLIGDMDLYKDLISGSLQVNSHTKIGGRVNLLNIFKRHVDVEMNCNITVSLNNNAISDQKCKRSVKL
ncbi:late embryogenesis abundant protein At1g64065-like [Magnolia sinica]|uniref:late embryogenesis abundant protein At1g64065-like n=1 Tax=Magnolia sinica TaxID=86752 RepID=UPI002659460C|nr:late embryogenesis abundant protein At1g64065-like [Magnolia sinica]